MVSLFYKVLFLSFAVVLSLMTALALAATFSGRVIDATTGQPIAGASIILSESKSGTSSNPDGTFNLEMAEGNKATITISSVGYQKKEIQILGSDTKFLQIELQPQAMPLGSITVTANRYEERTFLTQPNITVADAEQFGERNFSTTAEVLREEPGILVQKTTYGHGAPIIRGLIGKYVLLAYNGIRLNKPTFRFGGNQYLNTIDLQSLDRVEIARGPSSVMYGSDAIGGVVNAISRAPLFGNDRFTLSPKVTSRYSSADNGRSLALNIDGGFNKFSGALDLSYKKIEDLRGGGNIGKQVPTGWEEYDGSARLYYFIDNGNSLTVDYLAVRQNNVPRYDNYVNGDFEEYIYDPQDRDLAALTFDRHHDTGLWRSLKVNVSWQNELEGTNTRKTGKTVRNEALDEITTWGTYAQTVISPHARHRLAFGGEFYRDKVISQQVEIRDGVASPVRGTFPNNSKYISSGIYLQDDWTLTEKLSLTAGTRYNYYKVDSPLGEPFGDCKDDFRDITGSVGLTFRPIEKLNLIARWSQGFRAPSFNDLVVLKYSSSGVDAPSPGLKSEHSNNFELGAKVLSDNFDGELFVFYNDLRDLIDRYPGTYNGLTFYDEDGDGIQNDDEYDIYQKFNVDHARIYGFEYRGRYNLNHHWTVNTNCFWTRGENITLDEPLSRIPPIMGMAALKYAHRKNIWVEFFVRAAGDQRRLSTRDRDDSRIETNGTPGWATVNLRGFYGFGRISVNVNLENIADYKYKEHGSGIYCPGRNISLALCYCH